MLGDLRVPLEERGGLALQQRSQGIPSTASLMQYHSLTFISLSHSFTLLLESLRFPYFGKYRNFSDKYHSHIITKVWYYCGAFHQRHIMNLQQQNEPIFTSLLETYLMLKFRCFQNTETANSLTSVAVLTILFECGAYHKQQQNNISNNNNNINSNNSNNSDNNYINKDLLLMTVDVLYVIVIVKQMQIILFCVLQQLLQHTHTHTHTHTHISFFHYSTHCCIHSHKCNSLLLLISQSVPSSFTTTTAMAITNTQQHIHNHNNKHTITNTQQHNHNNKHSKADSHDHNQMQQQQQQQHYQ